MPPPDPKSSRLLFVYCIISTLFCFRFIHLAKETVSSCEQPMTSLARNLSSVPENFPRKIWQTSKTSAGGLGEDDRSSIQSWAKLNQKHRYEILTAHSAESYVRDRFAHRPDIEESFVDLQDPILRADFIRYLVLLGDGGIYSDLDTKSLKPIEDWIPHTFREKTNLVVGVEYDSLGKGKWVDWTLELQFATWAMMAKPGHLVLEITVDHVINRLRNLARKQEKTISGIKASFHEVLDTTGPALFTEAVMEAISFTTDTNFTWQNITGLTVPRLVGDILILPINAFGSGQLHSNSGSPDGDTALVQHLFRGSWKSEHPFEEKKDENADKEKEEKEENKKKEEDRKQEEGKKDTTEQ